LTVDTLGLFFICQTIAHSHSKLDLPTAFDLALKSFFFKPDRRLTEEKQEYRHFAKVD
jgi:hypothetical protein